MTNKQNTPRPVSAGIVNQRASRGPVRPRKARGADKRAAIREQR